MKTTLMMTALALAASSGVWAAEGHHHSMMHGDMKMMMDPAKDGGGMGMMKAPAKDAVAQGGHSVVATVNGLVCDFCAQSIQKMLLKEPGVRDARVDLSAKTVRVQLKDGATLDAARLGKLLEDAGYTMVDYKEVN